MNRAGVTNASTDSTLSAASAEPAGLIPDSPSGGRLDRDLQSYAVSHIEQAIEQGWVLPYYQPVVRTLTGKLCGFEALARWEDPVHGLLSPGVFIPALEEAGLIHLLDCSIVRQVCRQYRDCVNRGEPVVPVSFNLSRRDFDLCDIFAAVDEAAREYGVPRSMLNIEITETVMGTDPYFMSSMVLKFRDSGYQVWMDDFGSGYSTLNALKDFEFDELKIDMDFLNRFGDKSKTILASVVDMAKKLGIQTLAEGVETEEHREYLRRIGCEKMQGFLFGKPRPYDFGDISDMVALIGVETPAERLYIGEVGAVNTLSLSERDLTAGNSTQDYVTSMPVAIVEFSDDTFRVIESNRVFREGLANVGIPTIEEAERRINDPRRPLARQARQLVSTIEGERFARVDYVAGDIACVMRAKHVTTRDGVMALLVSIDDTIEQNERRRRDRLDPVLSIMYSIYEHVDVIHLDEGYIDPVFGNIGLKTQYEASEFGEIPARFAQAEVYEHDRERYLGFMDHDTMIKRIEDSGDNFLVEFFRLHGRGGDYVWKMFILIRIPDAPGNQVLLCIRGTQWSNDEAFQIVYDGLSDERLRDGGAEPPGITEKDLWRAFSQNGSVKLFWKDRERRFVGVNRAFLEYYGFESADELVGKTDEDMGWHIDPKRFMEDELRVLNEGEQVEDALGQCIVHGEVHRIKASKRPIYRNGRIVGLVGSFTDAEDVQQAEGGLPLYDGATGVLNYTGLEAATWQYVDAYQRQGIDFAMISVNVESFGDINSVFGYEFGEKVLRRIGEVLIEIAEYKRVVGHVYAERFVMLSQFDDDEKLQEICDEIERRLMAIAEVDGTRCTIYSLAGFSRFSEHKDIETMKRRNRDRRLERRSQWRGRSGSEGDVITSSLL